MTPAELASARAIGYRLRHEATVLHVDTGDLRAVVGAVAQARDAALCPRCRRERMRP